VGTVSTGRLSAIAALCCVITAALALTTGAGSLDDAALRDTYLQLRSARFCAAMLLGGAFAVAGVLVQGLFRNPLADPSVLGTTAGAVLGGKATIVVLELSLGMTVLGGIAPDLLVPLGCMAGAALALFALLLVARRNQSVLIVLLVGFALSSFFASVGGVLVTYAQRSWELGRALVSFALGSVAGSSIHHILFALAPTVVGFAVAHRLGPALDVLLSGEDEARSLGVDVAFVRRWAAIWVAVLTGAAVSLGGYVGFVGLVVPHALRPFTGVEHRRLLPFAAIFGGLFVALCDVAARTAPLGEELPLGVVTGIVGAPIFLRLLVQRHREAQHDV
jgi:iron complex transport system permease protein